MPRPTTRELPRFGRNDIVRILRERLALTCHEAAGVLEAVLDTIAESLEEGRSISLMGIGRFGVRNCPSKPGRNPKTGAYVRVPARRKAFFAMGRGFRKRLFEAIPDPETPPLEPESDR
jgi:nucleoid DNA-binding protein